MNINELPKSAELYKKLKRPFPIKAISWRAGATNAKKNDGKATKCIALAYIDARDVMNRFDDVFGLCGWQCRYSHANGKTICDIGIFIEGTEYGNGEWIWRAGGAGDTDIEAEKGAISDAFKRAAVLFGIGRYLYELPNEWVECDEWKHIKAYPTLPDWATPQGFDSGLLPSGNLFGEAKTRLYEDMGQRIIEVFKNTDEGKRAAYDKWTEFVPEIKETAGDYAVEAHLFVWFMLDSKIRRAIADLRTQLEHQAKETK